MVHHRYLSKRCPDIDLVEANHVFQAEGVVDHERGDGGESLRVYRIVKRAIVTCETPKSFPK